MIGRGSLAPGVEAHLSETMRLIRLGKVVASHGLRGHVRVVFFNSPPSPLVLETKEFYLDTDDEPAARRIVDAVQPQPKGSLVKFSGCDSRNDADRLIGQFVGLPEEALPPLDENEFYYYEIVGYRVQTTSGRIIGTIHETLATGSNDVWIVKDKDREYLIPVISEVVRSVDRVSRTVLIEPMEGLLDL